MTDHPSTAALERILAAAIHPSQPDPAPLVDSGVDPDRWIERLPHHRVAGLVARALDRADLLTALGERPRLALQRQVMDDQRERAALGRGLEAAKRALDQADIKFLLLKGAALGMTHYAEPFLRPMSDVDILVRDEQVEPCLAALENAGFRLPDERGLAFWREAYYNLPVIAPGEEKVAVEIHWSIAQERQRPDIDGLFARAREVGPADALYGVFSPPDLLLHQALHHAYHFFQPKLVWILDIAKVHLEGAPLDECTSRAAEWGMQVPLALSCLQVERVFPGVLSPGWRAWAGSRTRARLLSRSAGPQQPLEVLGGWQRRRRQLAYALLMIDRPTVALRGLAAWARRALRFGDRHGHEQLASKGQRGENDSP